MKYQKTSQIETVRHSISIPLNLVEAVHRMAPPEMAGNFNRLVVMALQEYCARRQKELFEKEMAHMATDSAICSELNEISTEFVCTEYDGLNND